MLKARNIVVVICSIVLAGGCLSFCLLFNIGHTASRLSDFLAKSPPGTLSITGFNNIRDLSSIDNLLFFQALRADGSIECLCIYAIDKSNGKLVWSTESLAKPLIEKYKQNYPDSTRYPGITDFIETSSKDHRLFVLINDTFYVLNSLDGSVIWSSNVDYKSAQITDKEVFLISDKQSLVAYDKASGRILWEHLASIEKIDHVWFSLHDSTVYERFEVEKQNFLFALNRADGKKKWQLPIREYNYDPVFFENALIFPQFDKWGETVYLTALDSESGKLIWEKKLLGIYDYPQFEVVGGQILLRLDWITPDQDHREYYLNSFDAKTGDLLWVFNQEKIYGEIHYEIEGDQIFIVTRTKHLFSLDVHSGRVNWSSDLKDAPICLLEDKNILVVPLINNRMSAYDAISGKELWNAVPDVFLDYPLFCESSPTEYSYGIDSGKLLIAGDKPWIKIFDISTGKQINVWKHNDRYQWLPQAHYRLGLNDGQSIYIMGYDGRFFVGSGPHRIFKVNADILIK